MSAITTPQQINDRKSMTFDIQSTGASGGLSLTQIIDNAVTKQADITGLESEESAGNKLAFAWKLISALACKLESLVAERTYEVVCRADTLPFIQFVAFDNTSTAIPFQTKAFNPTDGNFLAGLFYPNKAGYYHVDARFVNGNVTAHNDQIWLQIIGGTGGGDVDSVVMNTGLMQMQGSVIVYSSGTTQPIGAYIRLANHGYNIAFNAVAAPPPSGYLSIHYCGSVHAATIT